MRLLFYTQDQGVLKFDVPKSSVLIGRGTSCDVVLKVDGISRQHCRIDIASNGLMAITDLGSTNGVTINNKRIPINTAIPYDPEEKLGIGPIARVEVNTVKVATRSNLVQVEPAASHIHLELDLPDIQKTRKISRRSQREPKLEVVQESFPWPLFFLGVTLIGALSYWFLTQTT
jgi:hypothetical protein